jgi:hypothetical protein
VALEVETAPIAGEWVRHAPRGGALLGRARDPTGGRWQRGQVIGGLYLADEPATPAAEWYRFLAERGRPPSQAIPHDQHTWTVELTVADLSDPARLRRVGLPEPTPTIATVARPASVLVWRRRTYRESCDG